MSITGEFDGLILAAAIVSERILLSFASACKLNLHATGSTARVRAFGGVLIISAKPLRPLRLCGDSFLRIDSPLRRRGRRGSQRLFLELGHHRPFSGASGGVRYDGF